MSSSVEKKSRNSKFRNKQLHKSNKNNRIGDIQIAETVNIEKSTCNDKSRSNSKKIKNTKQTNLISGKDKRKASPKEFKFKNVNELEEANKSKLEYCNIGTQTCSPLKLKIEQTFHVGSDCTNPFKAPTNFFDGRRRKSSCYGDNYISDSMGERKWSTSSTLIPDEDQELISPLNSRRSSLQTVKEIEVHGQDWDNIETIEEFDYTSSKITFLLEDIESINYQKVDDDIKKLQESIRNFKLSEDIKITNPFTRQKDWLIYPTCCSSNISKEP